MDKEKVYIVVGLSVVILGIIVSLYFYYSGGSTTSTARAYGMDFAPPSPSEQREQFKSKLEAYKEKEQEKNNPVIVTNPFKIEETAEDENSDISNTPVDQGRVEPNTPAKNYVQTKKKEENIVPESIEQEPEVKRRRVGFAQKDSGTKKDDNGNYYAELVVRFGQEDKVKTGTLVYMRTIDAYKTANGIIPSNTLITGTASLEGSRLLINVEAVKVSSKVMAKNLLAYDLQGNLGLPVNASIENEVTNDAINEGINEASSAVNIPIISSLGSGSIKKITNASTVEIHKGGKFILKTLIE